MLADDVISTFKNTMRHEEQPQAILLESSDFSRIEALSQWLLLTKLCTDSLPPCEKCLNCRMYLEGTHPDVIVLSPEKSGGTIKISDIRALQLAIEQKPVCALRRMVLISPLERMMDAAANAFLKTLEEPPSGTVFVMLATDRSRILPTILSRCHVWHIPDERYDGQHKLSDEEMQLLEDINQFDLAQMDMATFIKKYAKEDASTLLNRFEIIFHHILKLALASSNSTSQYLILERIERLNQTVNKHRNGMPVNIGLALGYILL